MGMKVQEVTPGSAAGLDGLRPPHCAPRPSPGLGSSPRRVTPGDGAGCHILLTAGLEPPQTAAPAPPRTPRDARTPQKLTRHTPSSSGTISPRRVLSRTNTAGKVKGMKTPPPVSGSPAPGSVWVGFSVTNAHSHFSGRYKYCHF